jgi:hypothetical protein
VTNRINVTMVFPEVHCSECAPNAVLCFLFWDLKTYFWGRKPLKLKAVECLISIKLVCIYSCKNSCFWRFSCHVFWPQKFRIANSFPNYCLYFFLNTSY